MTINLSTAPTSSSRTFLDLSDKDVLDNQGSLHGLWGYRYGSDWDDLLTALRVLIVSEAGVGKTYECQTCQQRLWAAGEPAFFLELATLADTEVVDMLGPEARARFDAWLGAQSDTATFFLDSVDELKITQKSFELALTRLSRAISGHLRRARIIITTRPIPIDRALIERHLPIPTVSTTAATPQSFADVIMRRERKDEKNKPAKLWRYVGLMPLTREQVRQFATLQGVSDADALLTDIERRNAEEYAQRPQDLIELCSDWKEHQRIRRHGDQVETSAVTKLKARTDRREKSALTDQRAIEGASRLALAALLGRKFTIRYSAESDAAQSAGPALDASKVLGDWSQPERDTLLERGLFSFANYGRVRFHHRSVLEYLAAKRLYELLRSGVTVKAVKRIVFAETLQGELIVRPSMRPVAAWLSIWRDDICGELIRREPETLLIYGDPQSLSPMRRSEVLKSYVQRYGRGGWRGLNVPSVQVHRFASPELTATIHEVWNDGIENPEVRALILELIGVGRFAACADIAYAAVMSVDAPQGERLDALEALIQLNDHRLKKIAKSIEVEPALWAPSLTRTAMLRLFPLHLEVAQLCALLSRTQDSKRAVGGLGARLPQLIREANLRPEIVQELRAGLLKLVVDVAEWKDGGWPHEQTKRPDLVASLVAACNLQFRAGLHTPDLIRASTIAMRFSDEERRDDDFAKELRANLENLSPSDRELAFWADDAFLENLHTSKDAWGRVFQISHHGGVQLNVERDREWILRCLASKKKSLREREMMLWAAMVEMRPYEDYASFLESLKPHVADRPELLQIIENRLKPTTADDEMRRMEAQSRRDQRRAKNRDAEAHASWVKFWKEIADNPDEVFKNDRAENTAWNLWQAMERSGSDSRAAGWNRRFIEQQFGVGVADRLRATLQRMWRKDKPTLRSERPEGKRDTFLVRWQLGLAAIYGEAEDEDWAKKLTHEEALLASRFAPFELNEFPSWLHSLISAHPGAVDATLGEELGFSLREATNESDATIALQNVLHASPEVAALFVPRIRAWLGEVKDRRTDSNYQLFARIERAIDVLMKHGDAHTRTYLESVATKNVFGEECGSPIAEIWLPVLLQLNPAEGVTALEKMLKSVTPQKNGAAVTWFATLFDRDRRGTAINLRRPEFTPELLTRLARLAYTHVRPNDDVEHEGTYSPEARDHAERGRHAVLSALLATTGAEGWMAKVAIADDPMFNHSRDRILAIARESSAEEVESAALSEVDIVALDKHGEVPPTTRDALSDVMRDRLDDIEDLLLQDVSPREMWAGISDERVMRRALAKELRDKANRMFTVDQEGATADEKETDIRLRATRSDQQAVIELKIGEKPRSANALRKALKDQLLKKYMASDECRAGCLLITLGKSKIWNHPKKKKKMEFFGLISFLNEEAERLSSSMGGAVKLSVRGLDLRPRLDTEKITKGVGSAGRKGRTKNRAKTSQAGRAKKSKVKKHGKARQMEKRATRNRE